MMAKPRPPSATASEGCPPLYRPRVSSLSAAHPIQRMISSMIPCIWLRRSDGKDSPELGPNPRTSNAGGGDRTRTARRPQDFKSRASASSATPALALIVMATADSSLEQPRRTPAVPRSHSAHGSEAEYGRALPHLLEIRMEVADQLSRGGPVSAALAFATKPGIPRWSKRLLASRSRSRPRPSRLSWSSAPYQ